MTKNKNLTGEQLKDVVEFSHHSVSFRFTRIPLTLPALLDFHLIFWGSFTPGTTKNRSRLFRLSSGPLYVVNQSEVLEVDDIQSVDEWLHRNKSITELPSDLIRHQYNIPQDIHPFGDDKILSFHRDFEIIKKDLEWQQNYLRSKFSEAKSYVENDWLLCHVLQRTQGKNQIFNGAIHGNPSIDVITNKLSFKNFKSHDVLGSALRGMVVYDHRYPGLFKQRLQECTCGGFFLSIKGSKTCSSSCRPPSSTKEEMRRRKQKERDLERAEDEENRATHEFL